MSSPPTSSMHPELHPQVQLLLDEADLTFTFRPDLDDDAIVKERDTAVMGRLCCTNTACGNRWTSKRIAITIYLYHGNKYNVVVWHQRCEKCNQIAAPTLGDSYPERVARWLKIWKGVEVPWSVHVRTERPPHQAGNCEGCKAGHCI